TRVLERSYCARICIRDKLLILQTQAGSPPYIFLLPPGEQQNHHRLLILQMCVLSSAPLIFSQMKRSKLSKKKTQNVQFEDRGHQEA
ncbi:mCG144611, partial [Mus musculus]